MIKITGTTETEPDGLVVLHSEADGRESTWGPFDRRSLLAALGAEPDESDYGEVLAENTRLGRKLSAALRERNAARVERDAARLRIQEALSDRDSWKDSAEEARKDRDAAERERDDALEALRAAEEAPEDPRDDQDQIDRSWALERAGEVLGRLAAVGIDAKACGVSLLPVAEWILGGEQVDRG